ncbi:MAG: OmpA family protein [Labilithrix sp.]|nr:OmpA family protein [Labilithrix sp.]
MPSRDGSRYSCSGMLVAGPQRGLFLACLFVGIGSVLALDLHFAPQAISAESTPDTTPAPPARAPGAADGGAAMPAARVVIPAPARVPTIVARFESASKEPLDESAIRVLATAMIEDHDVTIVLEGHSDTRGGDDYNHTISLERATWVKSRLVALGVSAERIEAVGLGATRPLRSDDPDAPSVNRRVEVRWLGSATREASPPKPVVKAAPPREPGVPKTRRAGERASSDAGATPGESGSSGATGAPDATGEPGPSGSPGDVPPSSGDAPSRAPAPPSDTASPGNEAAPRDRHPPAESAPPPAAEPRQTREEK